MSALSVDFAFKETYSIEDLPRHHAHPAGKMAALGSGNRPISPSRNNFIEETYEAVEAIDNSDPVLPGRGTGRRAVAGGLPCGNGAGKPADFPLRDVADGICQKLIQRHPHIFGDVVAGTLRRGAGQLG